MRFLAIIVVLMCVSSPLAFGKSGASFDEFVKSREIVTTLYFQSNNEDLSSSERKRLSGTIDKLRELQKNGRMIRVEGFSSPEGDQEQNFHLSFFRARSVAVLIEANGLPAEVTLTGYGDLLASSNDPKKERRVEIASYVKPVGMKRVKVANKKKKAASGSDLGVVQIAPKDQVIDSYTVEQAIRRKIDNKNKALADKNKMSVLPGLSQAENEVDFNDSLDRGYTQWRKSVDPSYAPKLSQSRQAASRDLNRGYSQSRRALDKDLKRGYSQSQRAADSDLKRDYSQSQQATDSDLKRGYSQSQEAADSDLQRGYSQWQKSADPEIAPGVTQITPFKAPFIDALMIEQAIMEKIGVEPLVPSATVSRVDVDY
ncbi:MAG: OmpA family protein [Desulfuromonadales bacterium]|nr:OmpA family protein [Desulfuromonadales bacterium]